VISEQIRKSYERPLRKGFTVTHFITVADMDRPADFLSKGVRRPRYEQRRQQGCVRAFIQIANAWLIVKRRGGPTPDTPSVTLSVPTGPDKASIFLNIRVADIQLR